MRKLLFLPLVLIAAGVIIVATATAATHSTRACSKPDNAGNWEVVVGHAATTKAAGTLKARAVAKGLRAITERDGCAKRWEVVVVAATQAKATAVKAKAVKDGFKAATIEKS
jgi:5,10-methenyltetrahydromethanopterin hydrogenase